MPFQAYGKRPNVITTLMMKSLKTQKRQSWLLWICFGAVREQGPALLAAAQSLKRWLCAAPFASLNVPSTTHISTAAKRRRSSSPSAAQRSGTRSAAVAPGSTRGEDLRPRNGSQPNKRGLLPGNKQVRVLTTWAGQAASVLRGGRSAHEAVGTGEVLPLPAFPTGDLGSGARRVKDTSL